MLNKQAISNSLTSINFNTFTSFGVTMKSLVEAYYFSIKDSNSFFCSAKTGTLTPVQAALYIRNISYLIHFTPPFHARAIVNANRAGDFKLAEYFQHKLTEEEGHLIWAENDEKRFQTQFNITEVLPILTSMKTLIASIWSWIEEDPANYLSYTMLAEHLTVIASPELLHHLETKCSLPRTLFSVVGNHVELDKDHVDEMVELIDNFEFSQDRKRSMYEAMLIACEIHRIFSDTLGNWRVHV